MRLSTHTHTHMVVAQCGKFSQQTNSAAKGYGKGKGKVLVNARRGGMSAGR